MRRSNSLWAVLEYGWYPLLGFLTTPYFLHSLGAQRFAHWILLTATVGFGGILSVGTGAATIKHVSAARGCNDLVEVERTIRAALATAIVMGGALSVLVLAVFWLGGETLFGRMGDAYLLRLTGTVAAALLFIEQLENVFSTALKGAENFGTAARLELACKTAQILAALAAFAATGSIGALYAALLTIGVVRVAVKARAARRILQLASLRPSFDNGRKFLGYAKWGWLQGLAGMFFGIADRLVVGSMLGAQSLAHYSVVTQLTQQIHAVPAAAISVIFPAVSRRFENEGSRAIWRTIPVLVLISIAMSSFFSVILLRFGNDILSLWLGKEEAVRGAEILFSLCLAYWLLSLVTVPYFVLLGIGRIRFVGLVTVFSGIAALLVMVAAAASYGFKGAPFGRLTYAACSLLLVVPLRRFRHTTSAPATS